MNVLAEVMPFLAAAGLALFIGALLTEAMVLVPMWRASTYGLYFRRANASFAEASITHEPFPQSWRAGRLGIGCAPRSAS